MRERTHRHRHSTRRWCSVGDERIAAGTVVWAAGVAGVAARRARSGRRSIGWAASIVAPDLSVPGHPEVFVAGDLMMHPGTDGQPMPGVAQAAMQAGRRGGEEHPGACSTAVRPTPFRYRDPGNMATIGRARAIADLGWIR